MTHTILIWLFPFYLIVVEAIFRAISGAASFTFVGPAIATAGIGFLLPLTKPREAEELLGTKTAATLAGKGGSVIYKADQNLIPIVWLFILISFLVWFGTCYSAQSRPNETFLFVPEHMAVGFVNYFIAAVLAGIKSRF